MIRLGPGAPARVLAVLAPVVAVALVAARAARDGLAATPDDPVSPWLLAVLTVGLGCWLGWRALGQRAELAPGDLRCRNLVTAFAVDWDRVESLIVTRRGPIVVIDFGTATTYDAVSGRGEYLGGVIAPGVEISLDALYTRAAALRRVELVEPRSVIGRTTVESIQAGALYGFAGQVDGICRRMAEELGDLTVVATGGLAEWIAPYTASIQHIEPWLTLHGLRLVFARNA